MMKALLKSIAVPHPQHPAHSLRIIVARFHHVRSVFFDSRKHLGVAVGRLHKAGSFEFEYVLGTTDAGVDKCHDLESRTEFVLQTERMAESMSDVLYKHEFSDAWR